MTEAAVFQLINFAVVNFVLTCLYPLHFVKMPAFFPDTMNFTRDDEICLWRVCDELLDTGGPYYLCPYVLPNEVVGWIVQLRKIRAIVRQDPPKDDILSAVASYLYAKLEGWVAVELPGSDPKVVFGYTVPFHVAASLEKYQRHLHKGNVQNGGGESFPDYMEDIVASVTVFEDAVAAGRYDHYIG